MPSFLKKSSSGASELEPFTTLNRRAQGERRRGIGETARFGGEIGHHPSLGCGGEARLP